MIFMFRVSFLLAASLSLCAASGSALASTLHADRDNGPLDRPLVIDGRVNPEKPGVVSSLTLAGSGRENPVRSQEELREAVAAEQKSLERLPRAALEVRAKQGERAAQVVLGADFAKEAALLSFAPAAANDALSDAVRWYSLAASRGFPGAPSLDQAGIRFFPIRVQRQRIP